MARPVGCRCPDGPGSRKTPCGGATRRTRNATCGGARSARKSQEFGGTLGCAGGRPGREWSGRSRYDSAGRGGRHGARGPLRARVQSSCERAAAPSGPERSGCPCGGSICSSGHGSTGEWDAAGLRLPRYRASTRTRRRSGPWLGNSERLLSATSQQQAALWRLHGRPLEFRAPGTRNGRLRISPLPTQA